MSFICEDCPRRCKIDREKFFGTCGVKKDIVVAKIIKNFMWEEPSLCFDKGVTAIFFSGCPLKCEFCQNEKISRNSVGKEYSVQEFVELLKEIDKEETDGIDLVSPTQFTSVLAEVFEIYKPKHKVIWNSNAYENEENIAKISKFVDVFLPDFKYHSEILAKKLSKIDSYNFYATKAIKKMSELKPIAFENENMKQGVIVRLLILPDETQDAINVLEDITANFPEVYVSVMSQFVPNGKGEKTRKISPLEYKIVLAKFNKLGLKNGYFQEMNSSSEGYIPNF